jgi:phenylacetate-CoA oxygenase PaaJ subunit
MPGDQERMAAARVGAAWQILASVEDPEIPALSIVDLGLIRFIDVKADGRLEVGLSPTYVGCPATEVIRRAVRDALRQGHLGDFEVMNVLSPAWTSDWITADGRRQLLAYGIVPPRIEHARRGARRPAVGMSPLPFGRHGNLERIWFHALQGPASLPRLPRTLRILQVHLTWRA